MSSISAPSPFTRLSKTKETIQELKRRFQSASTTITEEPNAHIDAASLEQTANQLKGTVELKGSTDVTPRINKKQSALLVLKPSIATNIALYDLVKGQLAASSIKIASEGTYTSTEIENLKILEN